MKAKACIPFLFPLQLACEGKSKFFLTVLPTTASWNDENGIFDSSDLMLEVLSWLSLVSAATVQTLRKPGKSYSNSLK